MAAAAKKKQQQQQANVKSNVPSYLSLLPSCLFQAMVMFQEGRRKRQAVIEGIYMGRKDVEEEGK